MPIIVVILLLAGAGAYAGLRLRQPAPSPAVTSVLPLSVDVPSSVEVPLPFPTTGEGAVSIPSIGVEEASVAEKPVPVASLTKLMTAYIVLHDHPLAANQAGPSVTVTQADVTGLRNDAVSDDTNAQVTLGEQITEQQLLGGLLVHSADNYADLLAGWDAGTIPAFIAKMNATAAALGMTQTHFADASGISPQSVSTAGDILKVAAPDMAYPVVVSIVDNNSVTLPVAGTLSTYTPLLGLDGIIGVKSGYTDAAGGCDVVAVLRSVHGHPTLLLAAVTGQTGPWLWPRPGCTGWPWSTRSSRSSGPRRCCGTASSPPRSARPGRASPPGPPRRCRCSRGPAHTPPACFHPVHRLSAHARPRRAGGQRRGHARHPACRRPRTPHWRRPAALAAPAIVLSA